MLDLLKELIQIESVSGNEQQIVAYLSEHAEKDFPGMVDVLQGNIVITLDSNTAGPTILFCSHIDTVPAGHDWTKDPFAAQEESGCIYGLGANDALASVVSMYEAAKLSKDKISKGKLILAFVREEERGGGGFANIEPTLPRYDFAIFGEPMDMNIGYCMRGGMHVVVRSRGQSCHASRPWEGNNAMFKLAEDLIKIKNLPLKDDSPWGQATVEPTVVHGGEARNQIPDLVETTLDIRPTFKVDNDKILQLLEDAGLEFEVKSNKRRPMMCDTDSQFVTALKKAAPAKELKAFGGSCDMAFSTAPSIVMGPGKSERSHAPDEFIRVEELEEAVQIYQSFLEIQVG